MSCIAAAINSCPNLQGSLNEYFNTSMTLESMPWAEFIASDVNRNGLTQTIHPTSGKLRRVELRYKKRLLESTVAENQSNPNCVATTKRGDCLTEYEIDPDENLQVEELFANRDWIDGCQSNPFYFAELLANLVDVLERKVATKIANETPALVGAWAGDVAGVNGSDQLVVKTLKDGTTQELDPFTFEDIDIALQKTGYGADGVIIAGGETLYKYFRRIQAGCCAQQGIDLSSMLQMYGKAVAYDRRLKAALGSDHEAIVTRPGALALLHYTQAGWLEGMPAPVLNSGAYYQSVVLSPRLAIPFDLYIKDDCGSVSVTLTATTKLVGLPADMFSVGDEYEGVQFVNEVLVTNI